MVKRIKLPSRMQKGSAIFIQRSVPVFFLVVLCVVFWTQQLAALDPAKALDLYVQDNWQAKDGLPDIMVNQVLLGSGGHLWLATASGLARFDGDKFEVFTKHSTGALPSNVIGALCEDSQGLLWIGTGGGLATYKNGRFSAFSGNKNIPGNIFKLYLDSKGNLWIGSSGFGIACLNPGSAKVNTYTAKDGLSGDFIRSILEDKKGRLWVGTRSGLSRFMDGKFVDYTKKLKLPNPFVRKIFQDSRGTLWVATYGGGLCQLQEKNKLEIVKIYTTADGLPNNYTRTIYEDSSGILWLGSRAGLSRMIDGAFSSTLTDERVEYNLVNSILEDREKNLWVGTETMGLYRLKDGTFKSYSLDNGLANGVALCVFIDNSSTTWVGMRNGLYRKKEQDTSFTQFSTPDEPFAYGINSITEDLQGYLWVGMESTGLKRLKKEAPFTVTTYTRQDGLASNTVRSLWADPDGTLWIGTYDGGFSRFKDGRFKSYTTEEGVPGNFVKTILRDRTGKLWIGTESGLALFNETDERFEVFSRRQGLSGTNINVIHQDPVMDGAVWIGTFENGLNRFKDGTFLALTHENGLHSNSVFQLLEDGLGNFWLGSPKGISRISRQEIFAFTDGGQERISPVIYNESDGMISAQCTGGDTQPAGGKSPQGKLWFATTNGVAMVDPKQIKTNLIAPPVHIKQVVADDDLTWYYQVDKANLSLPPAVKSVEFHYTALSYYAPEKIRFKYRLEGFDRQWKDVGNRRIAYYTNIPPGYYRFRVIACNNDGVWNYNGDDLAFYLKPYFYQTTWFYLLCGLILLFASFGIYRLRVRQLNRRRKELERLVEQRTRQLEDSYKEVEKLSVVARETDNAVFIMDAEGNFEWINETYIRAINMSFEEFLETHGRNILQSSLHPNIEEILRQCLEEKKSINYETSEVKESGETKWYQVTLTPILDEENRVTRLVAISSNVSKLKQREELIRAQNEEMLKQAQELKQAIDIARREREAANAANQAKSEFLARMSHEIRTPLNGIIGFTDMLLDTELNDEQRDYTATINRSSEALTTLVNDILDFSRIEAGELSIYPVDFQPRQVIADVFDIVRPRLEKKPVTMAYHISQRVPERVRGDQGRFRQVLLNLVGNAVKFTEKGEIQLTGDAENGEEKIVLHFTVHDTGIGIAREKLNTIFDVFQQADGSTTREYGGAGLGLSISRQIARLMGGDVWAESKQGKGSSFHFTAKFEKPGNAILDDLNAAIHHQEHSKNEPSHRKGTDEKKPQQNLHILLAEDNLINQKLVRFMLIKAGYRVTIAENGEEALQLFTSTPDRFNLIFMDIQMPKMNGFEATCRIRQRGFKDIPIIAITAQSMKGDREKCVAAGMDDYIAKPIKQKMVLEMIKKWCPDKSNG
jgi:PAS domain S-box-containing protein